MNGIQRILDPTAHYSHVQAVDWSVKNLRSHHLFGNERFNGSVVLGVIQLKSSFETFCVFLWTFKLIFYNYYNTIHGRNLIWILKNVFTELVIPKCNWLLPPLSFILFHSNFFYHIRLTLRTRPFSSSSDTFLEYIIPLIPLYSHSGSLQS